MFLNFKKQPIKDDAGRIKALENIRELENTTNKFIAATNRQLYLK